VPGLDEAIAIAARTPGARFGTIEIPPGMEIPGFGDGVNVRDGRTEYGTTEVLNGSIDATPRLKLRNTTPAHKSKDSQHNCHRRIPNAAFNILHAPITRQLYRAIVNCHANCPSRGAITPARQLPHESPGKTDGMFESCIAHFLRAGRGKPVAIAAILFTRMK
jgi:hypothetical protein